MTIADENMKQPTQSWFDVLAEVEADVAKTAQRLTAPDEPLQQTQADLPVALAPALAHLPTVSVQLPSLEEMPPVPPELGGRILVLQEKIEVLQEELRQQLATLRASSARRSTLRHSALPLMTGVEQVSRFVDLQT